MEIDLSIVLPTFNEMKSGILPKILSALENLESFELILVDRKSEDSTVQFIKEHSFFRADPSRLKVIITASNERGRRLMEGFQISAGRIILLHHPRSFLTKEGLAELLERKENIFWGGFTHQFDLQSTLLLFTSWYSNYIRGDLKNIFYLDHCIFATRNLLLQTGIPDAAIFEDTILSKKLSRFVKPIRFRSASTTSSIRFQKNGFLYQSLLNQIMKLGYYAGIPYSKLNYFYEKSLELNSKIASRLRIFR